MDCIPFVLAHHGITQIHGLDSLVKLPAETDSKYTHTKPLNTVSVILLNENDQILTVQNGGDERRSLIGGWITRGFDGAHSIGQAMDAAYVKIAQETNNGDTKDEIDTFYRTHSITVLDSFSYDQRNYGHLVVVARWLPLEAPLIGEVQTEGRYETHNHKWWPAHVFANADYVKGCTKHDIRVFLQRDIPLF